MSRSLYQCSCGVDLDIYGAQTCPDPECQLDDKCPQCFPKFHAECIAKYAKQQHVRSIPKVRGFVGSGTSTQRGTSETHTPGKPAPQPTAAPVPKAPRVKEAR